MCTIVTFVFAQDNGPSFFNDSYLGLLITSMWHIRWYSLFHTCWYVLIYMYIFFMLTDPPPFNFNHFYLEYERHELSYEYIKLGAWVAFFSWPLTPVSYWGTVSDRFFKFMYPYRWVNVTEAPSYFINSLPLIVYLFILFVLCFVVLFEGTTVNVSLSTVPMDATVAKASAAPWDFDSLTCNNALIKC